MVLRENNLEVIELDDVEGPDWRGSKGVRLPGRVTQVPLETKDVKGPSQIAAEDATGGWDTVSLSIRPTVCFVDTVDFHRLVSRH